MKWLTASMTDACGSGALITLQDHTATSDRKLVDWDSNSTLLWDNDPMSCMGHRLWGLKTICSVWTVFLPHWSTADIPNSDTLQKRFRDVLLFSISGKDPFTIEPVLLWLKRCIDICAQEPKLNRLDYFLASCTDMLRAEDRPNS